MHQQGSSPPPGAITLLDAFHLALGHFQAGRAAQAVEVTQAILAARPDFTPALHLRGVLALQAGDAGTAVRLIGRAVEIQPDYADALANLGNALYAQGRFDEAVAHLERATALRPADAGSHYNLGNALSAAGRLDDAIDAYRRSLEIDPTALTVRSNLGNALVRRCRHDEALACYREVLARQPDHADAYSNLGLVHKELGHIAEAINAFQRAIALKPDHVEALSNLGSALKDQARHDEAAAAFTRALAAKPDFVTAHSNLVFLRTGMAGETGASLRAAHEGWAARHADPALPATPHHPNARDPGRRLKVGYFSPDFRTHSVSYFFEPLLVHHDRAAVEVTCYAEVATPSATTLRLQERADRWRYTIGLTDAALAEQIRADGIDILVDLAGHTSGGRLTAFAGKPAPVQVTWLGYPNTTGMKAFDYRLVDAISDPPGTDGSATETLVRLPQGFLCYGPSPEAPAPHPAPVLANGFITFGSFNNLVKLTPATIAAWAAVLQRVPGSRLFLKSKQLADLETARGFLARFADQGVAPERIDMAAWAPSSLDHLDFYGRVDIGLDPFPYNGTTTTCEALWMGVPVLALQGDRHAARVGASLLSRVGLPELIAADTEEYIATAAALAADPARLAGLRGSLRERMRTSPLCDGPAFAAQMEAAYRAMWRRWCEGQENPGAPRQ